jgi:1,4-dihydroxy-6-naphthoate synthase
MPDNPRRIRIGHSPDADDAFMFYALAKGKIPAEGFEIEHVIEDIESLNQRAFSVGAYCDTPLLEVTALSCHAYGFLWDRYQLLPYGASVGDGYGPILVSLNVGAGLVPARNGNGPTQGRPLQTINIRGKKIAVPGRYTTAYLVLQLYEADFQPVFTPFDQIFSAVEKGEADFGLLIHEGQLAYQELGFQKVLDLGEWWQNEFHLPLPLGINAIRRDLEEETVLAFTRLFRKSLEYAEAHRH